MKKVFFLFMSLFVAVSTAQIKSQNYYEGKIGKDLNIRLYLAMEEDDCYGNRAKGYYKYQKSDGRILLNIFFSEKEQNLVMVEEGNTGILILNRKGKLMEGVWIAPNGKKQLKVELKEVAQSVKEFQQMEEHWEKLSNKAKDC